MACSRSSGANRSAVHDTCVRENSQRMLRPQVARFVARKQRVDDRLAIAGTPRHPAVDHRHRSILTLVAGMMQLILGVTDVTSAGRRTQA